MFINILSYIFSACIIGLLGWFSYNQISAMVKSVKKRKQQKDKKSEVVEVEKNTTNKD